MSGVLAVPVALRLLLAMLWGVAVGAMANWASSELAGEEPAHSPWARRHPFDARSSWADRLPIVGWVRLRRMQRLLGYDFWIRPLMVELVSGALGFFLYFWIVCEAAVVRPPLELAVPSDALVFALHAQFAIDALLVGLLLVATLVDYDARVIPDELTVTGTLVALVLLPLLPQGRLIDFNLDVTIEWMQLAAPNLVPEQLGGLLEPWGLVLGLACFWLWCVGLLPRTWASRRGWKMAARIFFARIARSDYSRFVLGIAIAGGAWILGMWAWGGQHWEALLSSLVGMAVGGGMIWILRLCGSWALRREAMGFGDVTLLAMIGAFLGWQPAWVVFFLAPMGAVAVSVWRYIVARDNEIYYGPFLCLAALVVMLLWPEIWGRLVLAFEMGWPIPAITAICLSLIPLLLLMLRFVRYCLARPS